MEASENVAGATRGVTAAADRLQHRHLAPNVVCLFDKTNSRVRQPRWRGQLPSNVANLTQRRLLAPGTIVTLVCKDGSGGQVQLIERCDEATSSQPYWTVRFLDDPGRGQLGMFAESKLSPIVRATR